MIVKGSKVSIEYTLSLEDGTVVDTNVGKDPLVFDQGAGMIIIGLETRLEGLKTGDIKKVDIPAEEAYGAVNPKGFQEVPRDKIPTDAHTAGTTLQVKTEDGKTLPLRIHEVKDDTIIVDFNHPLAGKALTFDVKILDVR